MKKEILIKLGLISSAILIVGIIISLVLSSTTIFFNSILISILSFVIPVVILKYKEFLIIKEYERYFPVFLSDIAEAKRSGLSFSFAIMSCKGNYGAFTKEVRKMQKQLSWGVSVEEAFAQLRERVKESSILPRAISIITECYRTGGDIEKILSSVIENVLATLEAQAYKKSVVHMHLLVMYGVFFMFLFLSVAIVKFMLPFFSGFSGFTFSIGETGPTKRNLSPCASAEDALSLSICGFYNVVAEMFNFGEPNTMEAYYKSLYTLSLLVVGACSGIIAGQISTSNWSDSAKHALILVLIALISISILNALRIF